jgi:hypothetical protein
MSPIPTVSTAKRYGGRIIQHAVVADRPPAPVEDRAIATSHRTLQLLLAATVRADQVGRPSSDVDGAEGGSLAAPSTSQCFPHFGPAAVRTGHGRVAGEQESLVEDPAVSAEAGLRALGAAADRAGAGLGKNSERRLLGMWRREAAPGATARILTLDTAAFGTDELSSRDDRRLGPRREQKDPVLALLDRRSAVPTRPTSRVPDKAIPRKLAAAALAAGGPRALSRRRSGSRSCHRRGSSRASGRH